MYTFSRAVLYEWRNGKENMVLARNEFIFSGKQTSIQKAARELHHKSYITKRSIVQQR